MGGSGSSIYNENEEVIAQDVAHPESGNTNVEFINNVNSNTNNSRFRIQNLTKIR